MNEMERSMELLPGERLDEIGFGGLLLIQEPSSFCYGIDAVLLADFAAAWLNGEGMKRCRKTGVPQICDLGTGTGIIPLILSHKVEHGSIAGVEVQQESAERALRNVIGNGLNHRISIICGDVANGANLLERSGWEPEAYREQRLNLEAGAWGAALQRMEQLNWGEYDLVTSNPPYMRRESGLVNSQSAKTIARHETTADLEDFIRMAAGLLKERGCLCLIHRPSRLVDLCVLCRRYRLEPKALRPVSPREGEAPNLILIRCIKGGGPELSVERTLSVYSAEGRYTTEVLKIYGRTDEMMEFERER